MLLTQSQNCTQYNGEAAGVKTPAKFSYTVDTRCSIKSAGNPAFWLQEAHKGEGWMLNLIS